MTQGPFPFRPPTPSWYRLRELPDHARLFLPPLGAFGIPELALTGLIPIFDINRTHRYQDSLGIIFEEVQNPDQTATSPIVPDNTCWHVLAAHAFHSDTIGNKTVSVAYLSPAAILLSVNLSTPTFIGTNSASVMPRPIILGPGCALQAVSQQALGVGPTIKLTLAAIYVAAALGEHVDT